MSEDKKGHGSHGKKVGTIKLTSSTSQHPHLKPIALQYNPNANKSSKEKTKDSFPENNAGYIEEQFILRVPDQLAQSLRQYISEQQKPYPGIPAEEIGITFQDDGRNLVFQFREEYIGTMVDLPCIIESQKTVDNINYYKSADIGQMIMIHDEQNEDDFKLMSYDSDFKFHHGITPPTKNIRRRRFRKITEKQKQELSEVEDEMLKLMKGGSLGEEIEIVDASQLHNYDASPAQTPQSRNLDDEFAKEIDELDFDDEETMEAVVQPLPKAKKVKEKKEKEKKERKEKKEKRKGKGKGKTAEQESSNPNTPLPTTPRTPGSLKISIPINRPTQKVIPQTSPAQSPIVSPQAPSPTDVFSPTQGPSSPVTISPSFANFLQPGPLSPQVTSVSPTMEYSANIEQYFNPQMMETTATSVPQESEPAVYDFRNDPAYLALKNEENVLFGEIQQLQATLADLSQKIKTPNRMIAERFEKKIQEVNPSLIQKQDRLAVVQQIQMRESGM